MEKKVWLIVASIIISTAGVFAQHPAALSSDYNSLNEIIPPSPNAASLGKYGEISSSRAAGLLDLSIPLYQFSSHSIKVPLLLTYSSMLKVDEIASDVGMSWSLNAGGVITRTVYGLPDEYGQWATVPADFPQPSANLVSFMNSVVIPGDGSGHVDEQPDQFSFNFNGYSGKFILDSTLTPVLLTYSGLKVESNLVNSSGVLQPWHFKITAPDGVQYFFGGGATESSNTVQGGNGCGKIFHQPAISAFYINKIVHPNNDSVMFAYSSTALFYVSSTNETAYGNTLIGTEGDAGCYGEPVQTPPASYKCSQYLQANVLNLKQINSSGGGMVNFNYIPRQDMSDSLLSGIDVYQPNRINKFKSYHLSYQYATATQFFNSYNTGGGFAYRPFLTQVTESSADISLLKTYTLFYNDINSLPPRLSYAQDHFGYFNGKNNTTLLPLPADVAWQSYLPTATANREIDTNFCSKGLLTKIVYPTGGQDSIVYQPVTNYQAVTIYPPITSPTVVSHSNSLANAGANTVSDTLVLSFSQQIKLTANCAFNGTSAQDDPVHNRASVVLKNMTTGQYFYNSSVPEGTSISSVYAVNAGTYIISCDASGIMVDASASLRCQIGAITTQNENVPVGGNRVYKIVSSAGYGSPPSIKKYFYSTLNNLSQPSASQGNTTRYQDTYRVYSSCEMAAEKADPNATGSIIDCGFGIYDYAVMYSNSLFNVYRFGPSLATHRNVVESYGENFENGGCQFDYSVAFDLGGNNVVGNGFYNAPFSSYTWRNAHELHQYAFKAGGEGFVPVKEVYAHYQEDPREQHEYVAYLCNKKYSPTCTLTVPDDDILNAYDLYTYSNFREWVYVDTVRTLQYDNNGANYVADTVVTQYGNPLHALPTQQKTTTSNGTIKLINTLYPYDLTLSGDAEVARQTLIARYMISPALQKQETINGNNISTAQTNYSVFSNGLVLPRAVNVQTANFPIEKRLDFTGYNNFGQILEQAKTGDVKNSYIWDYNSMYPVAETKNAVQSDIAYTSFEADGAGNWAIPDTTRNRTSAITGSISYNLNSSNTITRSGLNSSNSYIVSYWSSGGPLNVNGTTPTAKTSVGSWTYYEHLVTGTTSVNVSGNATIDELRLFPKGALMTTYTYAPLVGMTGQCTATNYISYYSYDGLGRLKVVKDMRGNIIKTYDYHYKQ